MNSCLTTPERAQMQAVLSAALRDLLHAEICLKRWTAHPVSKRGKQRAVLYDLEARVAGLPRPGHFQCVGKFYERDEDARRVATILQKLARTDCAARGGLVLPTVLTHQMVAFEGV